MSMQSIIDDIVKDITSSYDCVEEIAYENLPDPEYATDYEADLKRSRERMDGAVKKLKEIK